MIALDKEDIFEIYILLDKLIETFRQNENIQDNKLLCEFIDEYFPLISKLYYETVWNALTIEQRKQIVGEEDYVDEIYGVDYFIDKEHLYYIKFKHRNLSTSE
ncbi:hypothetical protein MIS46_09935 [Wielerella bovis]|uniref:hypothetical protein n=1 Tax=Wielerella bovis TaxID=2917790 RepID=UPI0020185791|nr:hypothetical protein [Wielerella bovis]ULJ62268.1 hypothetical protein MIS46_09935 [Wielerella bovis]